jgi:hypothetical protein
MQTKLLIFEAVEESEIATEGGKHGKRPRFELQSFGHFAGFGNFKESTRSYCKQATLSQSQSLLKRTGRCSDVLDKTLSVLLFLIIQCLHTSPCLKCFTWIFSCKPHDILMKWVLFLFLPF